MLPTCVTADSNHPCLSTRVYIHQRAVLFIPTHLITCDCAACEGLLQILAGLEKQRIYKDVSKSSRTVLVKRSLLTLDVKFLHHLQSTPLLHEYSGPSVSAMLGSIPGSPFLELCQVPAAIPLESLQWC